MVMSHLQVRPRPGGRSAKAPAKCCERQHTHDLSRPTAVIGVRAEHTYRRFRRSPEAVLQPLRSRLPWRYT